MAPPVKGTDIIDITLRITADLPVWPGDPPPILETVASLSRDGVHMSRLSLGTHTGTHVDAPSHFIAGGRTVDQLDLDALLGPCCVIDMTSSGSHIRRRDLERCEVRAGARILFKTPNSDRPPTQLFRTDFCALEPSAADYLRDHGVRLVGIDGPSVDVWGARDFPCHRSLLQADVIILENLVLRHVVPGAYELVALPLNLADADGSPIRALLRPSQPGADTSA